MHLTKPLLPVTAWLLVRLLILAGGAWPAFLLETDWSLIGWSFAGSTGFIVWEATQKPPIQRAWWERAGIVGVGMLVSLAFTEWIAKLTGAPSVPITVILSAVGYVLFGRLQKRAKTAKNLSDLTNLADRRRKDDQDDEN